MNHVDRINQLFDESIAVKQRTKQAVVNQIAQAGELLAELFKGRGKLLICGNGGSAADAQHLAAELVNRFEQDRRGLAAIALTTDSSALTSIGNDFSFSRVFARQVEALGLPGDVLLAISTGGQSANIVAAIEAAQQRQMRVVLLSGRTGGPSALKLTPADIAVCVPAESTARIQEAHLLIIHSLCDLVDRTLFG